MGAVGRGRAEQGAHGKPSDDTGSDPSVTCLSGLWRGNARQRNCRGDGDSCEGFSHGAPSFASLGSHVLNDRLADFLRSSRKFSPVRRALQRSTGTKIPSFGMNVA
jgi:hypothetical protein